MKKLLAILATALLFGSLNTTLRAQDIQLYMTEHELPNLVNCLPAPPDTIGEAFTHDIMRYMWGKAQRLDSARLAQANRDAIWDLDAENGFIYTYGGRNGDYKLLKKFRLPR